MSRLGELVPLMQWVRETSWGTAVFAGFIGAIVAIPQAITFSYLVGVPIDHGLVCAVVVSLISALFGNSILMSGPNTATAIMLGISATALSSKLGQPLFATVMQLTLLIGVLQLLGWLVGAVRIFNLLSKPAISGITMAVGVLIIRSALDKILGKDWLHPLVEGALLGFGTIGCALVVQNRFKKSWVLFAMTVGMLLTLVLPREFIEYLSPVEISSLTLGLVNLGAVDVNVLLKLVPSAAAIAFISLAQSMVIASDLKGRVDRRVSLSREALALGLGNLFAPLFGAYAGAGSFNRTQVNEEMGAKDPAPGVICALFCLMFVTFAGGLLSLVPVAVVAGVLFVVGYKMIKLPLIRSYFQHRGDALTFSVVFLIALTVGIGVATVVALAISVYGHFRSKSAL